MIRPGAHAAVVVPMHTDYGELACQFGKSTNKGTPQVLVTFEVLRGPDAGQKLSWFGYFTDGATQRTLDSLRICGFVGEELDKFPDQRPNNEVQIVVEHETYEGKPRAKIAWINDPNRAGVRMEKPMDMTELRKFSAQFKSKLKTLPPVKTIEAKREPPTAAPPADEWSGNDAPTPPSEDEYRRGSQPVDDSDIPF